MNTNEPIGQRIRMTQSLKSLCTLRKYKSVPKGFHIKYGEVSKFGYKKGTPNFGVWVGNMFYSISELSDCEIANLCLHIMSFILGTKKEDMKT